MLVKQTLRIPYDVSVISLFQSIIIKWIDDVLNGFGTKNFIQTFVKDSLFEKWVLLIKNLFPLSFTHSCMINLRWINFENGIIRLYLF
jgi:hypothetical protein